MDTISLFSILPDVLPEFIQLIPAGEFRAADNRGPFRLKDAPALFAAFAALGRVSIDENHSTDLAGPKGSPAPASGWIVALENRNGETWGRVEWNKRGRELMEDKAYRGISPVLNHSESGDVTGILRVALTNNPGLTQLNSLFSKEKNMTKTTFVSLFQAAGLSDQSDETALLTFITNAKTFMDDAIQAAEIKEARDFSTVLDALTSKFTKDVASVPESLVSEAEEAAGLEKGAGLEKAVKTLCTLSRDADKSGDMRKTILSLQERLDKSESSRLKEKGELFIDQAIKDGKPIRALRDDYIARFMREPDQVTKEISMMPSIHTGGIVTPPPSGSGTVLLTREDEEMISSFGLDREKYIDQKKREGERS